MNYKYLVMDMAIDIINMDNLNITFSEAPEDMSKNNKIIIWEVNLKVLESTVSWFPIELNQHEQE